MKIGTIYVASVSLIFLMENYKKLHTYTSTALSQPNFSKKKKSITPFLYKFNYVYSKS